ncbi:MAG: hypothetical protein GTO45_16605 [Candidatus Aminicenantes bacterium]|nr:hypothetical protein [Candidatus Aminicenantes bacterium]NIM80362.1 hypothetical protein [Candidatus Aminicenantes bacterium]NIN19749.1 hypothetical protein [Candidatus Aminicenantes bacterium]NIN43631.1 hypothetical protein [Candidatus Aminicenantes bacterium]NIN86376.1 hypothetical protein [Candidatus Aminicenantes bacterium]
MQEIENELEEPRLMELEEKKFEKFKKWEIPLLLLVLILLYFLVRTTLQEI